MATTVLPAEQMAAVKREAIFTCCKWDPQAEDVSVLSDFALTISPDCWRQLSAAAEALYQETLQAEAEIITDPKLIKQLALPASLAAALIDGRSRPSGACPPLRVMRFDFHPTKSGWRVSEVNSDVPGGYIEAAGVSALMARRYAGSELTANPVTVLASALKRRGLASAPVGLVHATAYMDDRQVMTYLQREFRHHGIDSRLLSPADITWTDDGEAQVEAKPLAALLRFFPAEWLPNLPGSAWKWFFKDTLTSQINPGLALLSQSKRFPLLWPRLKSPLQRWRELLPDTVPWQRGMDQSWVLKPAFGRVGDGIGLHGATTAKEWAEISKAIARRPGAWIAQRKFAALPCTTPTGVVYPCLGVYVIDGQAAGIYGRIAKRPLIDHLAQDVAVLLPPALPELQPRLSA